MCYRGATDPLCTITTHAARFVSGEGGSVTKVEPATPLHLDGAR